MYIAASINLVGQREKLTGQMLKLAGKCPVTDCYYEHLHTCGVGDGGHWGLADADTDLYEVLIHVQPPGDGRGVNRLFCGH